MELHQRIEKIVEYSGLSIPQFAKKVGFKTPQTIRELIKGNTKTLSYQVQEKIKAAYPEINMIWLVTGEGAMLESTLENVEIMSAPTDGATPIYNLDATCGTDGRSIEFLQEHIIGYVSMPNVSKSASIVRANGDSMTPAINDGDFIAVREVTDFDDIFYGQIYLVITAQNRMVKYVRRYEPDEENYVLLKSENPNYDDIKMPKKRIIKMFMVENVLSLQIRM